MEKLKSSSKKCKNVCGKKFEATIRQRTLKQKTKKNKKTIKLLYKLF